MNAAEVLTHFQDMGVLADIKEHKSNPPKFIIARATDGYAQRRMKDLKHHADYHEASKRIDSYTDDGIMVTMYIL